MPLDEHLPHIMRYEHAVASNITNRNLHMRHRSYNGPNVQEFVHCQCIFSHQDMRHVTRFRRCTRRYLRKCALKKKENVLIHLTKICIIDTYNRYKQNIL